MPKKTSLDKGSADLLELLKKHGNDDVSEICGINQTLENEVIMLAQSKGIFEKNCDTTQILKEIYYDLKMKGEKISYKQIERGYIHFSIIKDSKVISNCDYIQKHIF